MKSVSNQIPDTKDRSGDGVNPVSSISGHGLHRRDLYKVNLPNVSFWALVLGTISVTRFGYVNVSLSTLVAFALFGLLGFGLVWRLGSTSIRVFATVYGFATTAAIAFFGILTISYGVPYVEGGSDELHFEEMGINFSKYYGILDYGEIRGNLVPAWHNSVGYIYLVGLLAKFSNWFGGFHTMVPRLFNVLCLGLLSVLVHRIGLRLGLQKRTAVSAALFAGCLPLMMWVTTQTLRDLLQSLLLLALVSIWLPNKNNDWQFSLPILVLLSMLLLIPIWELRRPQALVALLFIIFAIMTNHRSFKGVKLILFTLPILGAAIYLTVIFFAFLSNDILDIIDSIESYTEMRGSDGTGGGLSSIVFESSLFPIGWLYRIAYALVSPLPVAIFPIDKAWLSMGTIIHVMFLPFMWMGVKKAIWHPQWRLIVFSFALFFIGMVMFTFTIRHITQYLPFAILLAALGFESHRSSHQNIMLTMGLIGGFLGLTYIVLKI